MRNRFETETSWRSLAKGDLPTLSRWLTASGSESRLLFCVLTIWGGVGIYGASVGLWRSPLMALYIGVKLPCIIFLTLFINGLINGMIAQILATGLSFGQTLRAMLMSFAAFALIVGSLSPVTLGMAIDLPGPGAPGAAEAHRSLLLSHTALIAFAGIVATAKLYGILRIFTGDVRVARKILFAWLAGNLFVGAQVGFILRPIFGSPRLEIAFLRPDALSGNFYETVWWALCQSFR